ncbi:enoyl-CoA hydratase-related protein [Leisingera sp. MMG026]|uniref:enoyl-CoA hydratase-related protein n=1 Tax=Leisingera sp. MMG026 TaxID=2909982 RepID=UPI001EFF8040|nr:enoyl-CoA hydratase-related protein [Leisingera sp. MMG026]MCF6433033.1 enoyl-CoA hydratase-related protein [Leisingera sp. MMG026]
MTAEHTDTADVVVERLDAALRLTMSAPQKKNAIGSGMYLKMVEALDEAAADASIRAVWIRGAGGVFTSGNDIDDFRNQVDSDDWPAARFIDALVTFPKPIVAQVEGLAIGIGTTMLLHCDLIYASKDTRFQLPFVNLGLVPEAGASYLLPRLIGQAKAAELILLGGSFGAEEAVTLGLVNNALPADEVARAAEAAVMVLVKQPPNAVINSKALLRAPLTGNLRDRVRDEIVQFGAGIKSEEFTEALTAFMERREPTF